MLKHSSLLATVFNQQYNPYFEYFLEKNGENCITNNCACNYVLGYQLWCALITETKIPVCMCTYHEITATKYMNLSHILNSFLWFLQYQVM